MLAWADGSSGYFKVSRIWGADEVECLALLAGRLGAHRDGGTGAGEADLVAGHGVSDLLGAAAASVEGGLGRAVTDKAEREDVAFRV